MSVGIFVYKTHYKAAIIPAIFHIFHWNEQFGFGNTAVPQATLTEKMQTIDVEPLFV
jgi:hypothetical protein